MNAAAPSTPHKFETLDALRGVAALVVVLYHLSGLFGRAIFPHGYLAVDLFFVLSGFVLSFAYQDRLDAGQPTLDFLKLRLIRLYPLYLVGLLLSFLYRLLWQHAQHLTVSFGSLLLVLLPSLFFLPMPPIFALGGGRAFALDYPAWSLFAELVANLLHAVLLRRRSTRTLLLLLLAAAALLCAYGLHRNGLNFGANRGSTLFSLTRVAFAYLAGMLLFRLWRPASSRAVGPIIPAALMLIFFAVPNFSPHKALYDLSVTLIAMPAIVLLAAHARPSARLRPAFGLLGTASYAVYVLHIPVSLYFISLWRVLLHRWPQTAVPASGILFLTLLLLLSVAMTLFYDTPIRRRLRTRANG